jgi:hypothetical protein
MPEEHKVHNHAKRVDINGARVHACTSLGSNKFPSSKNEFQKRGGERKRLTKNSSISRGRRELLGPTQARQFEAPIKSSNNRVRREVPVSHVEHMHTFESIADSFEDKSEKMRCPK